MALWSIAPVVFVFLLKIKTILLTKNIGFACVEKRKKEHTLELRVSGQSDMRETHLQLPDADAQMSLTQPFRIMTLKHLNFVLFLHQLSLDIEIPPEKVF